MLCFSAALFCVFCDGLGLVWVFLVGYILSYVWSTKSTPFPSLLKQNSTDFSRL